MSTFSNSTIMKGLEKILPYHSNSEDREEILGKVARYIRDSNTNQEKLFSDDFYKGLDSYVLEDNNDKPNNLEIQIGKKLYDELRNQKSYSLGLYPDQRKLKKFRRKENQTLLEVLKEYEQ